jgi:hypothetical protein
VATTPDTGYPKALVAFKSVPHFESLMKESLPTTGVDLTSISLAIAIPISGKQNMGSVTEHQFTKLKQSQSRVMV